MGAMIASANENQHSMIACWGRTQRVPALSKTGVVTQAWDGGDTRRTCLRAATFPCPSGGKFPGATLVQPFSGWFLKPQQGDNKGDHVKGRTKQRRHARLQRARRQIKQIFDLIEPLLAVATELMNRLQRIKHVVF